MPSVDLSGADAWLCPLLSLAVDATGDSPLARFHTPPMAAATTTAAAAMVRF